MFREQLRRGRTVVVRQTLAMPDEERLEVRVRAEVEGHRGRGQTYEVFYATPWRPGEDRPDLTGLNPPGGEEERRRPPSSNGNHLRKPEED